MGNPTASSSVHGHSRLLYYACIDISQCMRSIVSMCAQYADSEVVLYVCQCASFVVRKLCSQTAMRADQTILIIILKEQQYPSYIERYQIYAFFYCTPPPSV